MHKFISMLMFSLVLGASAFAQMEKVASVEGITEYHLDNGMKVLLFPDPSKPQVTVNVTYMVGSRHENYGETGMAHLLEHLVFKGTPDHPDISKQLKDHGAFFNGTTWFDRTNYFETLTATDENLEWALKMEADRMVNSYISAEDLESEMTVVRNEFERGENNPTRVLLQKTLASAFMWHNYGQSTIGARSDIENVPIDRLQAFYKRYYQPDNAILLVVGKFEEAQTKEWIQKYFGSIPRPERELQKTYTAEPTQDGERIVRVKRTGDVQALSAAYHICAASHPDYPALEVLGEILTAQPSGRLYKQLVETKKTTNVWSWVAGLREPGFLYIGADLLKEADIQDARHTLSNYMDTLAQVPFTDEEIERAKTSLLKNFELSFNDSRKVGVFMSNYIAAGDWRLAFLYRDGIKDVSLEDVQRVANFYLKPSNRTIGMFLPTDKPNRVEVPEAPNLDSLVMNYEGGEAISMGEAFDPTPQNIHDRSIYAIQDEGMNIVIMPRETRGDAVHAQMNFYFGSKESLMGNAGINDLVAGMMGKGTSEMSRQEIKDQFDALKTNVSYSGNSNKLTVNLTTVRDHLPEAIALASKVVRDASFPESEYTKMVDEKLASLEEKKSDPMALAQNKWAGILFPYPKEDVRYNYSITEEMDFIKSASLEDVKSFYDEFYGSAYAEISVMGDCDADQVKSVITEALDGWSSEIPYQKLKPELFDVETQDIIIETPDKANAAFFAGTTFPMNSDSEDYPALLIANHIFGGGGLSSRLADRIRQQDGLSYGVGSFMRADSHEDRAYWGAYAIYAPENLQALEQAFQEELELAIKDGFTEEEVNDAIKGWLQQAEVQRAQDKYLTSVLASRMEEGRDMMWDAQLEEKIKALTPDQVNAAFQQYIVPGKISKVKAGDFARVEAGSRP